MHTDPMRKRDAWGNRPTGSPKPLPGLSKPAAPVLMGVCPGFPLPAALNHLLAFTVVAGLLMAGICVAALSLLALKLWPR